MSSGFTIFLIPKPITGSLWPETASQLSLGFHHASRGYCRRVVLCSPHLLSSSRLALSGFLRFPAPRALTAVSRVAVMPPVPVVVLVTVPWVSIMVPAPTIVLAVVHRATVMFPTPEAPVVIQNSGWG
ncbi:hypothetical protein BD779DRAFT_1482587 [Infundibulicybe gibba]|nr:hypothetical protein BD779DRAFT_1482587 [Infundibulicybe gibba]